MTLQELSVELERFERGELALAQLHEWLLPVLVADSLDVEQSDEAPWVHAADETRLFWRLVYLFESWDDEEGLRTMARRVLACLASTRDAALAYELLPLILDQDRLSTIVEKHLGGTISRTGFLSVVAESGYPPHVKLWLERATGTALCTLDRLLAGGRYGEAALLLDELPA